MNTYFIKLINSLQKLVTFNLSLITSNYHFIGDNNIYNVIANMQPENWGGGER